MARFPLASVLTVVVLTAGISACQRQASSPDNAGTAAASNATALPPLPAAVPLAAGAPAPAVLAPPPTALPGGTPVRRARLAAPSAGYAYLDRAYGQAAALETAPPDYAFDYDRVRPWTWEAADRSREIVEPVPGGYRYYYYQPDADRPYLVRDPDYAYAYDGPALVAVYDAYGRPPPPNPAVNITLFAARYLVRAQGLYLAASARPRLGVGAADWAARDAQVSAARAAWEAEQARNAEWRAYHADHEAQEAAYWSDEHARRARAAERFADWRQRGFDGAPPALYAAAGAASVPVRVAPRPSAPPVPPAHTAAAVAPAGPAPAPQPVREPATRPAPAAPRVPERLAPGAAIGRPHPPVVDPTVARQHVPDRAQAARAAAARQADRDARAAAEERRLVEARTVAHARPRPPVAYHSAPPAPHEPLPPRPPVRDTPPARPIVDRPDHVPAPPPPHAAPRPPQHAEGSRPPAHRDTPPPAAPHDAPRPPARQDAPRPPHPADHDGPPKRDEHGHGPH